MSTTTFEAAAVAQRPEQEGHAAPTLYHCLADAIRQSAEQGIIRAGEKVSSVRQPSRGGAPATAPLAAWRLRKATEYIEANLADAIRLANLADAAGLTRMHFAAQFKAATGQRPHDYLLRRRIERAQDLLASTDHPIVQVAMDVGFQTQAHFASVFKRFAADTPSRWRHRHGKRSAA